MGWDKLKILLIHPQNYLQRRSTGIYGRSLRYAPLTMPTLKALVPADLKAEVTIVDEMVDNVDFNARPDLVGITAITGTAPRAYEIAAKFKLTGATVVLGGVHPTMCTDEALLHADCVVRGYAERSWPHLLRDFAAGRLEKVYEDREPLDPSLIVAPDRSTIRREDYLGWCSVEMSRGCSNKCDFCISHRFNESYISRPIGDVIAEIKGMKNKIVFFLDANLIGDRERAKAFFKELKNLRKWWLGCASLDVVEDMELVALMAESGCRGLLMGFESTRQETLVAANKTKNIGKKYAEVVDILHDHGILIQACFVFGFDTDDVSVFEESAEYIVNGRFDLPQISICTPFPGTPFFEKLDKEGRILTRDWSLYNGQRAVFRPMHMTPEELERGTDLVRRRAYSLSALSRRLVTKPLWVKPLVLLSYLSFRFYQYRIARAGAEQKVEIQRSRPSSSG